MAKHLFGNEVTLLGKTTEVRELQLSKQELFIVVTLSGITTEVNALHS
jgi:hypothetical protein